MRRLTSRIVVSDASDQNASIRGLLGLLRQLDRDEYDTLRQELKKLHETSFGRMEKDRFLERLEGSISLVAPASMELSYHRDPTTGSSRYVFRRSGHEHIEELEDPDDVLDTISAVLTEEKEDPPYDPDLQDDDEPAVEDESAGSYQSERAARDSPSNAPNSAPSRAPDPVTAATESVWPVADFGGESYTPSQSLHSTQQQGTHPHPRTVLTNTSRMLADLDQLRNEILRFEAGTVRVRQALERISELYRTQADSGASAERLFGLAWAMQAEAKEALSVMRSLQT